MQISCLGFNSLRRVSPRFQNLQHNLQRRVSPRFHNLRNGGNSNFRKTRNVGNLNFGKICDSTDSGKTSNTRVSPSSKIEKMCNATNSTETSNTRGSLSFKNLPIVEIWVASDSRNASNTRVSPRFQSSLNRGNSNTEKMQNVLGSRKISDMRVSPGLQSIPLEKKPYYGSCQNRKTLNGSHGNSNIEKIHNVLDSRNTSNTRVSPRFQSIPSERDHIMVVVRRGNASQDTLMVKKHKSGNAEVECVSSGSVTIENGEKDAARETGAKGGNSGDDIASIHGTSAAMVVKDKLRLFNKYFLRFSKKIHVKAMLSNPSAKAILSYLSANAKQSKSRPDLMAISEMLKKNEVLCHKKYFGDLPGIEVGHCFYFRAEMVALGLHKLLLKGIDYIGSPYVKSEYSGYTFPLACAIVLSDQYEDDIDYSEEIVYTGEGGNDLFVGKHQFKDQVMLRGNLALKRRLGDVSLPMPNRVNEDQETLESEPEPEFCMDGSSFGNVARFINHSCDPNLFVQCVLSSHHDVRLAHIVLSAADDIPPMQELTYDYNYAIDSVVGKTKQLPCFCGTFECRKRLY